VKIRPVGTELLRADGRTDMLKLIVAFRNYGKAPNDTDLIVRMEIFLDIKT